jgi:ectoine hydroxylase-related dioxygenase (phytanoyl-CoA dioxygenase family)
VDMDASNGATEIWLGSHHDPHMREGGPNEVPADLLEHRRRTDPPVRACARAGSLLIRDARLWHAGMPNPSPAPRPMVAMAHWCSWYLGGGELVLPQAAASLLEDPVLRLRARYTDGPIDHIAAGQAHAYGPGATG